MLGFLIPGPLTIICSWIPILGFMAPACMYVDRMLLSCTGTITGGSLWGEEGVSGILASCLGGGDVGFWGWLLDPSEIVCAPIDAMLRFIPLIGPLLVGL